MAYIDPSTVAGIYWKSVRDYLSNQFSSLFDSVASNATYIANIFTILGVDSEATHLGTFTGSTIADNSSTKTALQALETKAELNAANLANKIAADAISITTGTLNATTVVLGSSKLTSDGGLAIALLNKTGSPSVKGYLVTPSTGTNNAVQLTAIGIPDCVGVFLDAGVADGAAAWVVVSGIADVYFSASTTRGYIARIGFTDDTGEQPGQAIAEPYPTSPFATDKHFGEVGHVLESRTGAGLAKCVLHFN